MTNREVPVSILLLAVALCAQPSSAAVPLTVYGRLPSLEDVALSPDGSRVAFVRTTENDRLLAAYSLADHKVIGGLRAASAKLRSVTWADNDNILIVTSVTAAPMDVVGGSREWFQLIAYNVTTRRGHTIPEMPAESEPRIMNVIWGQPMVRQVDGHTVVYVGGLYLADHKFLRALFRADLQTGVQKIAREGSRTTQGWLVNEQGEVSIEEDYDPDSQRWWLTQRQGGRYQEVASGHEPIDFPQLLGFGPEPGTVLMQAIENGDPVWRLLSLQDGRFGPPMAEHKSLTAPIEDRRSYRMIGGVHTGDSPELVFFDPKVQNTWDSILHAYSKDRIRLVDATSDFKKIVVRVDGPESGLQYSLVDMTTHRAAPLGPVYEGVEVPLEVRRITYAAGDGLEIPAYLTLPHEKPLKNLPLIVLPHGGPAARDVMGFDWLAQALADQGYLVLQPNFRGSTVDYRFKIAGYGEWGRKMQTDLSDGVRYLVAQGMADPARVCIMGASYGGYAALAGVTIDPGVYRCAVSIAGISDMKRMLEWSSSEHGKLTSRFWDRFMGVTGAGDPALDRISPIKHIDAVTVPVLLIHGRDDTVVPYEQSEVMYDALKRAKKEVEMVTLKHEDHWLSRSETRLQMLQSSVAFLRAHNPPE